VNAPGSSLATWLARLETFSPHEIDLGLGRVLLVLERLELRYPETVFHIAGTNGKGSSVALAESLLLQSERHVGAYTSPHVLRYNERIRVNGKSVSDVEIVAAFERIDAVRGDTALTYFEFGTIAAMVVFAARNVDVALLEVGMGGRLDAVNAIEPSAGLITNVSLDHCDWLGDDVEAIAHEKAGIMRAGKPIVFASGNAAATILSHAEAENAVLLVAGRDYFWEHESELWSWQGCNTRLDRLSTPSLKGEFQIGNAAGVLTMLEAAGFDDLLQTTTVNRAFTSVRLPGRMQSFYAEHHWLLDVAHNPAAAKVLADELRADAGDGKTIAIVALLADKDVDAVISALADQVDVWAAVTAANSRAIDAEELSRRIANLTNKACLAAASLHDALDYARTICAANDRILVTGSFYLVGPVLEALEIYSPRF
jgi:dihydrofolate synthase/folylpolyglutamate synthase